jgi:translation initiation factor 2B subunit (eIF-2B alpha/beta/delta family)
MHISLLISTQTIPAINRLVVNKYASYRNSNSSYSLKTHPNAASLGLAISFLTGELRKRHGYPNSKSNYGAVGV